MGEETLKRWWVRWYGNPDAGFEYVGPWWQSGWAPASAEDGSDVPIFVAAVVASDVDGAKDVILGAYARAHVERNGVLEWSFVNERADDWEPFCERFPRAPWMSWPDRLPSPTPDRGPGR